jgi:putative transcriptional regulator
MYEYLGKLLIANPMVLEPTHHKNVYMVIEDTNTHMIGVCINRPMQNGAVFGNVMASVGLDSDYNDIPLYFGGLEITNRVFILHSLDWSGMTTKNLTDHIGVTTDVSILAALSQNQGPEYFRPCVGYTRWLPGQIELELESKNSVWSITTATTDICFGTDDSSIWTAALVESTKAQVNQWF